MSKSINTATLLGNVGQPPEIKALQNGTPVANLSLCTNERHKVGDKYEDRAEWHAIVAFGKLADIVRDYVHKGSKLYVSGRLHTSSWEDEHQIKRYRTCIIANEVVLLDARDKSADQPPTENYEAEF
jgi:single-strand DNA-binding protein